MGYDNGQRPGLTTQAASDKGVTYTNVQGYQYGSPNHSDSRYIKCSTEGRGGGRALGGTLSIRPAIADL